MLELSSRVTGEAHTHRLLVLYGIPTAGTTGRVLLVLLIGLAGVTVVRRRFL